jgi:transcription elongation factor Elf1
MSMDQEIQRRLDEAHGKAAPSATDRAECPRCEKPLRLRMVNVKQRTSEQECVKCGRRFNVPMPPERLPAYSDELKRFGVTA